MERIRGRGAAGIGRTGEGIRPIGFVRAGVPDRTRKANRDYRRIDRDRNAVALVEFPAQWAGVLGGVFLAAAVLPFLYDGETTYAAVVVLPAGAAGWAVPMDAGRGVARAPVNLRGYPNTVPGCVAALRDRVFL